MSIFNGVKSQYVDAKGKTRMLHYVFNGHGVSLVTSPLPPGEHPVDPIPKTAPLKIALLAIDKLKLEITTQSVSNGKLIGFWVRSRSHPEGVRSRSHPEAVRSRSTSEARDKDTSDDQPRTIYYGYVPVAETDPVPDVEVSNKPSPIRKDEDSVLDDFRKKRQFADLLKKKILIAYAMAVSVNKDFDEADVEIEVDPDLELVLDSSFAPNKIVVPSEKVADSLRSYLKAALVTDRPGVMLLVDRDRQRRVLADVRYQTVSDFRTPPNQLVFLSTSAFNRWKNDRSSLGDTSSSGAVVERSPLASDREEPYFYRDSKIRGSALMIVQNVKDGSLANALAVGWVWAKGDPEMGKINIGFNPETADEFPDGDVDIPYTEYQFDEGRSSITKRTYGKSPLASVLLLADERYAAMLFL
jgi:hypothetical protein